MTKELTIYRRLAAGNLYAGILLAHIVAAGGRLEATDRKIMEDTGLTQWELRSAKKELKEIGIVKVTRNGVPPVSSYIIDDKVFKRIFERISKTATGVIGPKQPRELKTQQKQPQQKQQPSMPKTKPRGFVYPQEFEALWKLHNVGDKWAAYKAWHRRKKEGYTDEDLQKAVEIEQKNKSDKRFYRHLSTLLNSDIDLLIEEWENENAEASDDIWLDDLKMTFKEAKARGLV